MTITERIGVLCKEQSISVRKLEQKTGLSTGAISKWAKSSPSVSALLKIADYFGVTLDYLTGHSALMTSSTTQHSAGFMQRDIGMIDMENQNGEDIKIRLEHLLKELLQSEPILFDGEYLDHRTQELLAISLVNLLENTEKRFRVP